MEKSKEYYDAITEGVRQAFIDEFGNQTNERGYAWVYNAIYEATKDVIEEAISKGKIKIK